jgi:hypothetical protein
VVRRSGTIRIDEKERNERFHSLILTRILGERIELLPGNSQLAAPDLPLQELSERPPMPCARAHSPAL